MKRIGLMFLFSFSALTFAQAQEVEQEIKKSGADFNRWSVEADFGVNKAVRPLSSGYFTSTPSFWNGGLGVRYMLSPMVGLKAGLTYNNIESKSNSNDFQTDYMRYTLEGVINAGRLLKFEDWTKTIGLLIHAGAGYGTLDGDRFVKKDGVLSLVGGATVQVKLSNKFVLNIEGNVVNNFKQSYTWDGGNKTNGTMGASGGITVDGVYYPISVSTENLANKYLNRLANVLVEGSIGVTYYLGKKEKHADWYTIDYNAEKDAIAALEEKINRFEEMMQDTDKDGVPDYLDAEPNSTPGVAVDSKGRVIDRNGNGIPDELESYMEKKYGPQAVQSVQSESQSIKELINSGYVTTYFDFNKDQPTNVSTHGIDFIRTYLINNPSATVDVFGHADEIGGAKYNSTLANRRAENVKNILVKAGIDASRINVISKGEDNSVDASSAGARKLVRRVTFEVK